ncbi:MAG TPA: lysophospholipid acyltransferase family protein [Streptosporangiaceae bacterium]|jgi:1-acyl-sn-glycerol-3-phosphate acyltransferase|nr:lysophospholipid acyltransferase family protein [Streptosporangiaceae bacterium]
MSKRTERGYSPGWRLFTKAIIPPLTGAAMKRVDSGRENVPRDGGMIIAPNHLSYADWPAVAMFCYRAGHYPVFLIKSGVFEVKYIGSFLRKVGQLPVYRGRADAALVLRDAEEGLRRGATVIVYPEGTASRDPGLWPMRARTGVARLALTTGVPVVPVAHWGAQDILPYGDKKPRLFPRKRVRIVAGPPVDLSAFADQSLTRDVLRGATDAVMADITKLLAGLRGEQPPAEPYDPAAHRAAARDAAGAEEGGAQEGGAGEAGARKAQQG